MLTIHGGENGEFGKLLCRKCWRLEENFLEFRGKFVFLYIKTLNKLCENWQACRKINISSPALVYMLLISKIAYCCQRSFQVKLSLFAIFPTWGWEIYYTLRKSLQYSTCPIQLNLFSIKSTNTFKHIQDGWMQLKAKAWRMLHPFTIKNNNKQTKQTQYKGKQKNLICLYKEWFIIDN